MVCIFFANDGRNTNGADLTNSWKKGVNNGMKRRRPHDEEIFWSTPDSCSQIPREEMEEESHTPRYFYNCLIFSNCLVFFLKSIQLPSWMPFTTRNIFPQNPSLNISNPQPCKLNRKRKMKAHGRNKIFLAILRSSKRLKYIISISFTSQFLVRIKK